MSTSVMPHYRISGTLASTLYNAAANRAAVAWMLSVGRAREFVAVSGGWC